MEDQNREEFTNLVKKLDSTSLEAVFIVLSAIVAGESWRTAEEKAAEYLLKAGNSRQAQIFIDYLTTLTEQGVDIDARAC